MRASRRPAREGKPEPDVRASRNLETARADAPNQRDVKHQRAAQPSGKENPAAFVVRSVGVAVEQARVVQRTFGDYTLIDARAFAARIVERHAADAIFVNGNT
jgi:hypothetical protein